MSKMDPKDVKEILDTIQKKHQEEMKLLKQTLGDLTKKISDLEKGNSNDVEMLEETQNTNNKRKNTEKNDGKKEDLQKKVEEKKEKEQRHAKRRGKGSGQSKRNYYKRRDWD